MQQFDGITIMPPVYWDAPDLIFSTDACLDSCGGWTMINSKSAKTFHAEFPQFIRSNKNIPINELELLAFVVAIRKWSKFMQNQNILAYCDNRVSVDIVNSGAASNEFSQSCLHEICFLMAKCNAWLKLVHLSSKENRISDCLSRWKKPGYKEKFQTITKGL